MRRRGRGHSAVLMALLAGSGGSLASCGFIVGVGDYAVGDAGADVTADQGGGEVGGDVVGSDRRDTGEGDAPGDGADGSMGDGMRDAPADATNEQADTASDGDGAQADRAVGDADAGSADADGAPLEAEAGIGCGQAIPTTADFQTLVSTCVLAISCDPYLFPVTLSDCITNNALQAANSFSCLSTITSCAGTTNSFYSCEGLRFATTSECPGITSSCDNTNHVAINCNYVISPGLVTDCSRTPTSACQIYDDSGTSSVADCVVANSCSLADAGGCMGNNRFDCISLNDAGIGVGRNCANATCIPTSSGAACQFNGSASCTSTGSQTCSGNTLQACDSNGQVFNYDCTRAGGACATNTGVGQCLSPGCSPSSTCAESCDIATGALNVCVGGAPYKNDCSHYGFSGCGPSSGIPVYCVP